MSMWTGASDELANYLAQREVERQRELVNATALQERAYQRQRDTITDERAARQDALAELRQKQADEDRDAARKEVERTHRYQNATALRTTMQPGGVTGDAPEEKQLLDEFHLGDDLFKKIALPVATFKRPAQPAKEGEIARIATETAVPVGPAFESLGGTDYQAKQRAIAAAQEAAAAAAQERAELQQERLAAAAEQAAQNRATQRAIAGESNATRQMLAQATVDARSEREANKPATAAERQVMAFYNRANAAHEVLTTPDKDGKTLEDQIAAQGVVGQFRGRAGTPNILQTNDQQVYRQAQRQFAESLLRRESGAAISQSEQDLVNQQYFAVPGDSPATVKLKQRAREQVVDGMKFGAGKAYREYDGDDPARVAAPTGTPKVTLKPGASLGADWGK